MRRSRAYYDDALLDSIAESPALRTYFTHCWLGCGSEFYLDLPADQVPPKEVACQHCGTRAAVLPLILTGSRADHSASGLRVLSTGGRKGLA